jgi:hypothetical protein
MHHRTATVVLSAPKAAVFEYLSRVENLPGWATEFARELRVEDGDAVVVNGLGEFHVAFRSDPDTGVIDMYAGPTPDAMSLFPTRVVELAPGRSAYTFTMFQTPGVSDELFFAQHESLLRELDNVRRRFG